MFWYDICFREALREGRTPNPPPSIGAPSVSPQFPPSANQTFPQQQQPQLASSVNSNTQPPLRGNFQPSNVRGPGVPPPGLAPTKLPAARSVAVSHAIQSAKYANSALGYEDVPTAVFYVQRAIQILEQNGAGAR